MVVKKSVFELWIIIKETLTPPDFKTLTSLLIDFKHCRIEKTQLIASSKVLFKDDEFLHRWFTDVLNDNKPQEKEQEDRETQNAKATGTEEGDPKSTGACVRNKKSSRKTKESERTLTGEEALADELMRQEDEIREDCLLPDTKVESNPLATRAEVEEKSKEDVIYHCDPKSGRNVGIEVPDEGESDKKNLKGKKRRILQQEPTPQKKRTSRRLQPVTPSYILEEEQCPVSDPVLNNKRSRKTFAAKLGPSTRTNYEVAMARCEDQMYETTMLMETL